MRRTGFLVLVMMIAIWSGLLSGAAGPKYDYYLTGNASDAVTSTTPGYVLMGGGTDVDEAFRWMSAKAGGGDFVVIRVTGADGYNLYVDSLGTFDSVETLVLKNRAAASDPFVVGKIRSAEALFIAGGDQSDYVNNWQGTPVAEAIEEVAARAPVGGTSAGLAILGEYVYSALKFSATSSDALANPYNRDVTLARDFLHLSHLGGIITDSHFVERDRMGRFTAFLARIVADGWATQAKGIAIEAQTALLVEPTGRASVVANAGHETSFVYFVSGGFPEVCVPDTPLTYRNLAVQRVAPGGTFTLDTWRGNGATYTLSVEGGAISSTQAGGGIY